MDLDWGIDLPPDRVAAAGGERVPALAAELPEVRELVAAGWFLAPESPGLVFLPAVWPSHARTWVPDRSTRYMTEAGDAVSPWPEFMYASVESDYNETLRAAGLAPRPVGRLWLLRPPPGFATLDEVLDHLSELGDAQGVDRSCCPQFVDFIDRVAARLFARGSR